MKDSSHSRAFCVLAAWTFLSCAHGQHDFVEADMPCGIRCALGAIALLSEDVFVPEVDPDALNSLPAKGRSPSAIAAFLQRHHLTANSSTKVPLTEFRPTSDRPSIMELTPEWPKRGTSNAGLAGVVYEEDAPHFVLALEREGTALLIWDVSVGHELIPLAELQPYFTGNTLAISPQPWWLHTAHSIAARRELRIAAGIALVVGACVLASRLHKSRTTN